MYENLNIRIWFEFDLMMNSSMLTIWYPRFEYIFQDFYTMYKDHINPFFRMYRWPDTLIRISKWISSQDKETTKTKYYSWFSCQSFYLIVDLCILYSEKFSRRQKNLPFLINGSFSSMSWWFSFFISKIII